MTDLRLFEQPAHQDQAVLTCGDRVDMPTQPRHRKDGWYAAVWCPYCGRGREVVSVIYVKAPADELGLDDA